MILQKKLLQSPRTPTFEVRSERNIERNLEDSAISSEIMRLGVAALTIFLFLSLASYSPQDPSFSMRFVKHTQTLNWMGRVGSYTADMCLQLLGLTSFFVVLLLGVHAMRKGRRKIRLGARLAACTILVLSMALLLQLMVSVLWLTLWPGIWVPWQLKNSGGVIGLFYLWVCQFALGNVGTIVFSVFCILSTVLYLFGWSVVQMVQPRLKPTALRVWAWAWQCINAGIKVAAVPLASITRRTAPSCQSAVASVEPAAAAATMAAQMSQVIAESTHDKDEEISSLMRRHGKTQVRNGKNQSDTNKTYKLPDPNMLSGKAESRTKPIDKNWYLAKGEILVQKLKDFGVDGEVVQICPGPVITVYEFKPASGVKIKEIANLSDDLTLALSVLSVRIVAPIPGKPVVGIEIPSPQREMVFFKDLIRETAFYSSEVHIPIVLGRLASGEPVLVDLATMPHLLVAGSTGTGKSVFINALICSLLYRYTPDQLKLILVDPKMVELTSYEDIPHLLLPVMVDSKKAAMALRWAVEEMERRYTYLHSAGVRHIDAYNEKISHGVINASGLPYLVIVIDEYADLMAVVPKDVELSIARLAQKARASGIHIVLATQRPSTDVVTGTIKANFPSRISFRVASSIDSKTILDRTGAERLLGQGDMLFHSAGFMSLKRMQGAFMSDKDIEATAEHWKGQGKPEYDERIIESDTDDACESPEKSMDVTSEENLYDRAVEIISEKGEASISLLQRHLRIGYNRAASLMEQLEKEGIVSQALSSTKRRSVLV